MFYGIIYIPLNIQKSKHMEVYAHIYKSKSGELYLLKSEHLENGKLLCWTGVKIMESRKGYDFALSLNVHKGNKKKDVLREIQKEINQKEI